MITPTRVAWNRICTASLLLLALSAASVSAASADKRDFKIKAQDAATALTEFGRQAGVQILFEYDLVKGHRTNAVSAELEPREAIRLLVEGSGLRVSELDNGVLVVEAGQPAARVSAAQHPYTLAQNDERVAQAPQTTPPASVSRGAPESVQVEERPNNGSQPAKLGEIVVTGSHIPGAEKSASPLIKLTREDIRRSGFATVDQLIDSLPQNFGAGASQDTIGTDSSVGNNGFGNSINLRGLGPGTSLVLLNGRRLAGAGNSGKFIDVSMIPLSAIERVEVLTDGASAIYGSDAVGGVVNFILKKDYEGAETSLRGGSVTDGDLWEYQLAQSLGGNWASGGAMLAYEYYERDPLDAQDRAFASSSASPRSLLPEQERNSLYANVRQDVGDRWSLFGDFLYSTRDAINRNAFLGLRVVEAAENEQVLGTLGAEVELGGSWSAQVFTSYSEYQFDARRVQTRVATGIDTVTTTTVDTDIWSFDLLANGALASIPGGAVRAAIGGHVRLENVLTIFGDDIPERHVTAAFGELFVPIFGSSNRRAGLEALELTLAGRYEKYNDFGSDVTPKVGLRWEPTPSLSLRATYGQSFKAPALSQLAPGNESLLAFIASDFGLVVPGDPVILLRTQAAQPDLHEEESTSWTAGFDFQPAGSDARMSLTYFDIEFKGRIDSPIAAGFNEFFASPDVFGDFIVANPGAAFVNARLAAADSFLDLTGGAFSPNTVGLWADVVETNIAAENQNGIDLLVNYPFATAAGKLTFTLNGTYITSRKERVAPRAATREALNLLNEPIDLRLRAGASWSTAHLVAALWVNYQDSYRNTDPDASGIGSWTTVDGQIRYAFDDTRAQDGVLSGLTVALSVQNLFDKAPPFVANQGSPIAHPGYDAVNATPLGRFVALEIAKAW